MTRLAAAATIPAWPRPSASLSVTPAQYALAARSASTWAYTTVGNIKHLLGVDAQVGHAVLCRLQRDGIIGAVGPTGLAQTPVRMLRQAQIMARAVPKPPKPEASLRATQRLQDVILKDEEDPEATDASDERHT